MSLLTRIRDSKLNSCEFKANKIVLFYNFSGLCDLIKTIFVHFGNYGHV